MPVTFRPGTLADSRLTYDIFKDAILDFSRRMGMMAITGGDDAAVLEGLWERRRPLFEYLARAADQFWIAEQDGQAIGYARAIRHDGLQELTEFFVRSGHQSAGVGRELLGRAFPPAGAAQRVIVATSDARAQALYLRAGVYSRFPIYYFGRAPQIAKVDSDLTFTPRTASPETLAGLGALDQVILGHQRAEVHAWLLDNRQGWLYTRAGQPVGYGYTGFSNGPFALRNDADFPAVLAHAEAEAVERGEPEFGVEVPLINRAAVDYLLGRGFRMDAFFAFFMSNAPFGQFENYLFTSPPFFL